MDRTREWRRHRADPTAMLEAFLLGSTAETPAVESLRRNHLEPYAYSRLPADAPDKTLLRPAFLAAIGQHLALKNSLQELLGAWRLAGIEAILFKGFYLAEFVYAIPADRHYSDVDLLIDPDLAGDAAEIAQELGWRETWRAGKEQDISGYRASEDSGHEVLHLAHPEVGIRLDVHRRIIHNKFPWTRTQERITRAAWNDSEVVSWGSTSVRVLSPLDSILIGLVLHRCWSSDDWHLKPHDILDFQAIVGTFGVTKASLEFRAEQLRCRRTMEIFLERCNPFRRRLDLQPPARWRRHAWNLAILPERGHPGMERQIALMARLPGTIVDMCREFPNVVAAAATLRSDPLLRSVGECIESQGEAPPAMTLETWKRAQRGVRWTSRLLRSDSGEPVLSWCYALFVSMRRKGYQARLTLVRGGSEERPRLARLEVEGRIVVEQRIDPRGSEAAPS